MKLRNKIFLGVGILILVILVTLTSLYLYITKSSTVAAQLHFEKGTVLINGISVTSDLKLKEKDIIETKDSSSASVILYESVIIGLDSNTKVTLSDLTKEHPRISQESGQTWNKFTKLLGVEDYSISYGNTIASVRGTFFAFNSSGVITGEGLVSYTVDNQTILIGANEVAEIVNGTLEKRNATDEEIVLIHQQFSNTIDRLRFARAQEIEKYPLLVNTIKSKYNLSDADIEQKLLDAEDGKLNIDELVEKSPLQSEGAEKIADLTKKIKEIKSLLNYSSSINESSE